MKHLHYAALPAHRASEIFRKKSWHEVRLTSRRMRLLQPCILSLFCLTAVIINPASTHASSSVVISVPDQTLALIDDGVVVARYPVSTSKLGLGDGSRNYDALLGSMAI